MKQIFPEPTVGALIFNEEDKIFLIKSHKYKVSCLEKRLVPEVKITQKEAAELKKIRKEIRQGETILEKELFSILSK